MNKKNLIRYTLLPLVAVLAFWLGGYAYFRNSADWEEIQLLVRKNTAVLSQVGEVKEISVSSMPFMYRFSGDSDAATLRVHVVGSKGEYRMAIEAQKKDGVWMLRP